MPREAVVVTENPNQPAITYPLVEIAWGHDDGLVQIGFQMSRERWIEIADMLRADPDIIDHTEYTGSITRKQLNDTIRTVRRARASAYGADE